MYNFLTNQEISKFSLNSNILTVINKTVQVCSACAIVKN